MNDIIIRKTCARCGYPKETCNFNKCANSKDGLNGYCKLCQKEVNHERYNKKKKQIVNKILEWQNKNPEKIESYKRNFYEKNK